jgi:ferric-dicitrate binding protein FerR (iron transport regulator)
MGKQWTDQDVERVVRSLKDEPSGDAFWEARVWSKIEASLPQQTRDRIVHPWYRRPSFFRSALVAACLMLALGFWRVQLSSIETDLADFMTNVLVAENGLEVTDGRCGLSMGSVDSVDADLEMEHLYESL